MSPVAVTDADKPVNRAKLLSREPGFGMVDEFETLSIHNRYVKFVKDFIDRIR